MGFRPMAGPDPTVRSFEDQRLCRNACPNPSCGVQKPVEKAFDVGCWRQLPRFVQRQIWASYQSRPLVDHVDFLSEVGERLAAGHGPWPRARPLQPADG